MVNPEVGKKVPDSHVIPAKLLAKEVQGSHGQTNADIAHNNELGITVLVERAAGIEVVDATPITVMLALATTLTLALMVVVASDVGDEVVGPADELLTNEHDESEDGGLLGQLRELVDHLAETRGLLLASAGNKDHVTLHVASGLVVLSVRDLPAEVGDEESRVKKPAGDVVDRTGIREGTVTALVGQHPDTSAEKTLEDSVHSPEASSGGGRGDVLGGHEVVPDGEGCGEQSEVAKDVTVSPEGGALEAVLGNGIVYVLDGEVGRSELVAVCVKEATVAIAGLGDIGLRHGRERG